MSDKGVRRLFETTGITEKVVVTKDRSTMENNDVRKAINARFIEYDFSDILGYMINDRRILYVNPAFFNMAYQYYQDNDDIDANNILAFLKEQNDYKTMSKEMKKAAKPLFESRSVGTIIRYYQMISSYEIEN